MPDAIAFLEFLAARRDTRVATATRTASPPAAGAMADDRPWASPPPAHDGSEEPTRGRAAVAAADARWPRIDPDGWLAAFFHGMVILAALYLVAGAALLLAGLL